MQLTGFDITEIHHTTIALWVREAGLKLPDVPPEEEPTNIIGLND